MHFLFNFSRIKGLYLFRELLAHPQEVLYKSHSVYCVRIMSVGCTRIVVELVPGASSTPILVQPTDMLRALLAHSQEALQKNQMSFA
jgi:hypothetical protein